MTVLSPAELAAIKARAGAATPGPWRWRGNADFDDPRLVSTAHRGGDIFGLIRRDRTAEDREAKSYAEYLRDVERYDTTLNDGKGGYRPYTDDELADELDTGYLLESNGEPRQDERLAFFNPETRLYDLAREIAIYEVCRDATSRDDERVYRADIVGLRNPNAVFIEHALADVDALLVHADALEEQGSRLTREVDLKVDEIERQAEELTVLERNLRRAQKVADDRGEEIQQLRAKLAALEAKPTSGPPHLDPRRHDRGPGWGHTQMLDAEHLNDPLPSLGSVHAACTPEGCPTVAGRTPYAEAGETE